MKTDIEVNAVVRSDVEAFLNQNVKEFNHIYMNFSDIAFIKIDSSPKPLEIYKVSEVQKALLPKLKYVIVAGNSYNYLGLKKDKMIYHVLKHIPIEFNGELVPHEVEEFIGEEKYK